MLDEDIFLYIFYLQINLLKDQSGVEAEDERWCARVELGRRSSGRRGAQD